MDAIPLPLGIYLIANAITQPTGNDWWQPLIQLGVAGVMLGWFMVRLESRLDKAAETQQRLARAIEQSTKAHMVAVAALKSIERLGLRDLAHNIVEEIDAAEALRNENPDR